MITIITGTPGAGKTLYAISKLLLPLIGTTIKQEVDGVLVEYPVKIYTNIRGLMIDHELIDGTAQGGLRNWHEWAKPGAVIVFDEIQKVWTPRANGKEVPPDIQALETHRHMGVDFIMITQGLMLTERNLAMLCGRHLHVRRVSNLGFALVYEWDHASRTLLYSKAIAKAPWRYDKKVFKLYKSADLHTKQKRSLPGPVWFIGIALVLGFTLGPKIYANWQTRFGKPEAVKPAEGPASLAKQPTAAASGSAKGVDAISLAQASKAEEKPEPVFLGCAATKARCTCYDADMRQVVKDDSWCKAHTLQDRPVASLDWLRVPDQERHQLELAANERADTELIAFATARDRKQGGLTALPASTPPLQSKTPERSAGTVKTGTLPLTGPTR